MSVKVPASRTHVGKYELGRTLGEGSFAKVKFAKNVETGDCVAIKIVDRDQVLRHKMVEQVFVEDMHVYTYTFAEGVAGIISLVLFILS